ncbi:MAG TPA: threonine synthase [Candidatus Nanoarchaeia archaeon]|nr:threonine synthase [Candidatus Nanoarchaeia archaeon]
MRFRSTNNSAPEVSFKEALLKGQAPDYGLYMPVQLPQFSQVEIDSFTHLEYHEIAFEVAKKFLKDQIPNDTLKKLCRDAYNFTVPLERLSDTSFIMRLDRGPTASFKDFAARLMARLMDYFAKDEKKKLTVLVATSGDTGSAVASAFYNLLGIKVIILFPEKEVSDTQRKQMTTLGGNVKALAIKGTFDDCQAIVKRAFNDKDLSHLNLTSANSINFGRLMPQMVYYIYAYSRIHNRIFSVPSGNFGNLMGGVLIKKMGLPIERFIVAVNENDEFPQFLKSGAYNPVVPSKNCSSNAMNVGHPSNLARLIDMYGGWLADERDENGKVLKAGVLKQKPDMDALKRDFVSYSVSDKEVDQTIVKYYKKYGTLIEPHVAVALAAYEKAGLNLTTVCLETADPAKFPEKIQKLLGIEPKLPKSLIGLDEKEEYFQIVSKEYEKVKEKIK